MKSYVAPCIAMLSLLVFGAESAEGAPVSGPAKAPVAAAVNCPADDGPAGTEVRAAASSPSEEDSLAQRANVLFSLVETRHPNGAVSVDLQDVFQSRVVMQRNSDGSTAIRCFPAGVRVVFPLPRQRQPLEER